MAAPDTLQADSPALRIAVVTCRGDDYRQWQSSAQQSGLLHGRNRNSLP